MVALSRAELVASPSLSARRCSTFGGGGGGGGGVGVDNDQLSQNSER